MNARTIFLIPADRSARQRITQCRASLKVAGTKEFWRVHEAADQGGLLRIPRPFAAHIASIVGACHCVRQIRTRDRSIEHDASSDRSSACRLLRRLRSSLFWRQSCDRSDRQWKRSARALITREHSEPATNSDFAGRLRSTSRITKPAMERAVKSLNSEPTADDRSALRTELRQIEAELTNLSNAVAAAADRPEASGSNPAARGTTRSPSQADRSVRFAGSNGIGANGAEEVNRGQENLKTPGRKVLQSLVEVV
jgi:predicted secreted protein